MPWGWVMKKSNMQEKRVFVSFPKFEGPFLQDPAKPDPRGRVAAGGIKKGNHYISAQKLRVRAKDKVWKSVIISPQTIVVG